MQYKGIHAHTSPLGNTGEHIAHARKLLYKKRGIQQQQNVVTGTAGSEDEEAAGYRYLSKPLIAPPERDELMHEVPAMHTWADFHADLQSAVNTRGGHQQIHRQSGNQCKDP
jgi:hypothetical protein